jgi:ATP-dependent RNA helicase DeaD
LTTFKDLGVHEDLIKGLNEMGIVTPTDVQERAIPPLLEGNTDLVAQAQTGTGKTAAYGLPLLQKIDPKVKGIQGLVLCPTRELGQQVAKQLFKYTKYTHKIFTEAVYGGAPIDRQIAALKRPTHIVVATPGRLIDLMNQKAIDLSKVHTIVLDEADEMLSLGFKKELEEILSTLATVRNKWLFSATLPHDIKHIVNQHLSEDAERIEISGKSVVNKNIDHKYILCDDAEKLRVLTEFLRDYPNDQGVIFCKTKAVTQTLAKQLIARNVNADCLHGDMLQKERDKAMRAFKNGKLQYLISTDLAARGIDIQGLAFVVHYQFPDKEEYYTHRSGRTARAGESGISMALVSSKDMKQVRWLEKRLHIAFKQVQ